MKTKVVIFDFDGTLTVSKTSTWGRIWEKIDALDEDEKLMNMLGYCYAYGVGTVVNKKRAFECYKKATELDNKNASYWKNLGDCYMNGIGTEINKRKAFECFLKCKKDYLKDPDYFAFIGLCYFKGIGTEINKEKAKKMFQKALEIKPDCKYAKELLAKCIDE